MRIVGELRRNIKVTALFFTFSQHVVVEFSSTKKEFGVVVVTLEFGSKGGGSIPSIPTKFLKRL